MTNTVVPDRAFGLAVDFPKNSKELPTRDLRSDGLIDNTTPSMRSKADATNAAGIERRQSRTSRCVTGTVRTRCPAHVRGAAIRHFEEVGQAADFPIATPPQLLGSVRGPNANPRRF